MKVLHICSYYTGSKLYQNMMSSFDMKKISQEIFIPVNAYEKINKNKINLKSAKYHYVKCFNELDRFIYFSKLHKSVNELNKSKIDFGDVSISHAHSLFVNGGIAYMMKKLHGIEYIVAIRNTDVNVFFKYAIHLRRFGIKILEEALAIVFISPAYQQTVLKKYVPNKLKEKLNKKMYVIPNGIDNFWHKNTYQNKDLKKGLNKINLISVGSLSKNKNIQSVIDAASILQKKGYDTRLTIVGEGEMREYLRRYAARKKISVDFVGHIKEQTELLELYRKSDVFVLPSFQETFGLVFIEAMSQGLPVIYTQGQGIDGYFKDGSIGYAINPNDPNDIEQKITEIVNNYRSMSKKAVEESARFQWEKITNEYKDIYI